MVFKLSEPNPELLEKARLAYRLAVQHRHRIDEKWRPRTEELRKADEFSRVRCAWENDTYRAEEYMRYAREVYLAITVALGNWPAVLDDLHIKAIEGSKNRDLMRARRAMGETRLLFEKLKKEGRLAAKEGRGAAS